MMTVESYKKTVESYKKTDLPRAPQTVFIKHRLPQYTLLEDTPQAVSYTHLDVYKRQVILLLMKIEMRARILFC